MRGDGLGAAFLRVWGFRVWSSGTEGLRFKGLQVSKGCGGFSTGLYARRAFLGLEFGGQQGRLE